MSWLPVFPRTFVAFFVALVVFALPASAAEPVLKLINAGSGEKITLRAQPKAGTSETMQMVMDMSMVMDMGGMGRMPQDLPAMTMMMKADIEKVTKDDITYTFELTETSVAADGADPMIIAAMEPELKKMVGTKGRVVVSSTGMTKSAELTPPPGASPDQFANMQKSMQHASAPFPVEPVGVGAVWEVNQNVAENGLSLTQTVTYTVKEIAGDKVTLATALVQKADNQKVAAPGMPPGTSANLDSLESTGAGETVIDMNHLFPTKGGLKHEMKTRMTISAEGQTMNMGMDMTLDLDMTRK